MSSSSSESDVAEVREAFRGRKRVRQPKTWKRTVAKAKRNTGQAYTDIQSLMAFIPLPKPSSCRKSSTTSNFFVNKHHNVVDSNRQDLRNRTLCQKVRRNPTPTWIITTLLLTTLMILSLNDAVSVHNRSFYPSSFSSLCL